MWQKALEYVLNKLLRSFIVGVNKDNLKVGLFLGDIFIEKVSINPDSMDLLQLPYEIRFSQINHL